MKRVFPSYVRHCRHNSLTYVCCMYILCFIQFCFDIHEILVFEKGIIEMRSVFLARIPFNKEYCFVEVLILPNITVQVERKMLQVKFNLCRWVFCIYLMFYISILICCKLYITGFQKRRRSLFDCIFILYFYVLTYRAFD